MTRRSQSQGYCVGRRFVLLAVVVALPSRGQGQPPRDPFDIITGLVFTPDGDRLLVARDTGSLYVLKTPLGNQVGPEVVLPKFLNGPILSPKGDMLAGYRTERPDVFLLEMAKMPRNWNERGNKARNPPHARGGRCRSFGRLFAGQ